MEYPFLVFRLGDQTWLVYVSLLVVAVFFRFSRPFAVRNLDLMILLTLSAALVAPAWSDDNRTLKEWMSFSLLTLSVLLILRLIFDEALTRRPRLEQNLNQAGITFLCIPAFAFLMTSVFELDPPGSNLAAVESGKALLEAKETNAQQDSARTSPPTETLLAAGATGVAELSGVRTNSSTPLETTIARVLVVVAHSLVVLGLIYIGRRHFNSMQLGMSMSCLYLLLPCTAFKVHELSHVLPGACLTWAVASYRKPAVAGILLGLACGTLFFAIFLLPLWAVFYGKKNCLRFGVSLAVVAAVSLTIFALTSVDTGSFLNKLITTTNWTAYRLLDSSLPGGDTTVGHVFLRITLAAVFFVMLIAMTVIPRRRNLENLLANSTALVVAAQLWYPIDVGSYVLWYLPLFLLVTFRPRLDRLVPPQTDEAEKPEAVSSDRMVPRTGGTIPRVTLYH